MISSNSQRPSALCFLSLTCCAGFPNEPKGRAASQPDEAVPYLPDNTKNSSPPDLRAIFPFWAALLVQSDYACLCPRRPLRKKTGPVAIRELLAHFPTSRKEGAGGAAGVTGCCFVALQSKLTN